MKIANNTKSYKNNKSKRKYLKKNSLINIYNITKINCIYLIILKAVSHKYIIRASEKSCLNYIGIFFFFFYGPKKVSLNIQVLN